MVSRDPLRDLKNKLIKLEESKTFSKFKEFKEFKEVILESAKILQIAEGLIEEYNVEMRGKQDPLAIMSSRIKLESIYERIGEVIKSLGAARKELSDLLNKIVGSNIKGLQTYIEIPSDLLTKADAYYRSLEAFENELKNIEKRLAPMFGSRA